MLAPVFFLKSVFKEKEHWNLIICKAEIQKNGINIHQNTTELYVTQVKIIRGLSSQIKVSIDFSTKIVTPLHWKFIVHVAEV